MVRLIITSLFLLFYASLSFSEGRIDLNERDLLSNSFWNYDNSTKEPEQYRQFIVPNKGKELFFKNFKLVAIFSPYVEQYVGCCVRNEYDFVFLFNQSNNSKDLIKFLSEKNCSTKKSINEEELKFLRENTRGGKFDIISCPVDAFSKVNNATKESVSTPDSKDKTETFPAGTYKVGVDIPAGEYKVFAKSKDNTGVVFVSDKANYTEGTVHNEIFTGQTYVSVKDGQYLRVNFGEFQLVK